MTKPNHSPLTRIFNKQQNNIKPNKQVANVLTSFAEDDYKRIAQLIKVWLDQDAQSGKGRRKK